MKTINKAGFICLLFLAISVSITIVSLVLFAMFYVFLGRVDWGIGILYRSAEVTSISLIVYLPFYLLELWGEKCKQHQKQF